VQCTFQVRRTSGKLNQLRNFYCNNSDFFFILAFLSIIAAGFIVSIDWIVVALDRANDLKALPRTGWLLAGIAAPESVADHSYATALLAMLLADAIDADWRGQGLARPLDRPHLLRIALLHDLAESILTDLPRRSADLLGAATKHAAEGQAMVQIFADAPSPADYTALWAEYAAGQTPEARLVRDADKLEMVHQALQYERRGQRKLDEFWQQSAWNYAASAQFFHQLCLHRSALQAQGSVHDSA
jgi:putative hydrolase of HD superfamily